MLALGCATPKATLVTTIFEDIDGKPAALVRCGRNIGLDIVPYTSEEDLKQKMKEVCKR